jgi:membrane-associated protease RseP (regulator of RpoE activity)
VDPRYPIGPFELAGEITDERRREWIEQIARLPAEFRAAVAAAGPLANLALAAVLFVGLVGVTITTSYEQLLPLWLALGLLTVWPEVLTPTSLSERGR